METGINNHNPQGSYKINNFTLWFYI